MARYTDANCKLCRACGEKLFLKAARCYSDKCEIDKRNYPPGQHGKTLRRKVSDYGKQLLEKQKVRRIYGILERQFQLYFERAVRMQGKTGENLLSLLERRLDNVVYRLGFAGSRKAARQLVVHGHFHVNGKRADIPSYTLRRGDLVAVAPSSKQLTVIQDELKRRGKGPELPWLELDKPTLSGKVLDHPTREHIPTLANEQLIVELYSK